MTGPPDPLGTPEVPPFAATDRSFTEGVERPDPLEAEKRRVPYTADLAAVILDRVAGGDTIREVCKGPRMPSAGTVRRWVWMNLGSERDAEGRVTRLGFGDLMAQALAMQAEAMADECVEIADENEEMIVDGDKVFVKNGVKVRELRIKTRQMVMAANARERWGQQARVAGPAAAAGTPTQISSAIRRAPGDPLLLEGVTEPVAVRPATGGLVDGHAREG